MYNKKNIQHIAYKLEENRILLKTKGDKMKKLFISQPMNGLTDNEILAERENIRLEAENKVGEPLELIDSFFEDFKPIGNIPLAYLGKSISLLADADVVYFGKGWQDARGCKIEHICAVDYGIKNIIVAEFDPHKTTIGRKFMDFEKAEEGIKSIIEKYWEKDEKYYSKRRYEGEEKEFNMVEELKCFLELNHVEFKISEEDGFDSAGYSNDFMAVSYKVNNGNNFGSRLGLNTVVFECM